MLTTLEFRGFWLLVSGQTLVLKVERTSRAGSSTLHCLLSKTTAIQRVNSCCPIDVSFGELGSCDGALGAACRLAGGETMGRPGPPMWGWAAPRDLIAHALPIPRLWTWDCTLQCGGQATPRPHRSRSSEAFWDDPRIHRSKTYTFVRI